MTARVQHDKRLIAGICLLLVLLCGIVFGQTLRHEFVNYDDPEYVYQHPKVRGGLSLSNVQWALTNVHARNWHPLTTLTHMADVQLFGLKPAGHHAVNVLLHTTTAIALFLVLRSMTGSLGRSAFVAAVFAVHPLRVESVAWVAERKDVLSGLLFVLTIGAYLRYTRRRSAARYATLLLVFTLGLLAKPMLVTLPIVLLLLDFWPLRRLGEGLKVLLEKAPLVALAAVAAVITVLVQKTGGVQREALPLAWRIGNAFVACLAYIRDTFWPTKLAPFYPHLENRLPGWEVAVAVVLLLALTAGVYWRRRKDSYLPTGWFWFLVMLTPVIGIIEVGSQARADRYTYLPQIGLLIAFTWGVAGLSRRPRYLPLLGAMAVILLAATAWAQTRHWRDSESLWRHTLSVTSDNHVAHNNIGDLYYHRGEFAQALRHYEQALAIRARGHVTRYDLLLALYHNNVGSTLRQQGSTAAAIPHYEKAIQLQPDYADAYLNLGGARAEAGDVEGGVGLLRKAVALQPENARAQNDLGTALLQTGEVRAAIEHYERALAIEPGTVAALNNLTWLYATSTDRAIRNSTRAVQLAEQALRSSSGNDPMLLHKVAAAQAANGNFAAAIDVAERGLGLAAHAGQTALAEEFQRNLTLYRAGTPLTDSR